MFSTFLGLMFLVECKALTSRREKDKKYTKLC